MIGWKANYVSDRHRLLGRALVLLGFSVLVVVVVLAAATTPRVAIVVLILSVVPLMLLAVGVNQEVRRSKDQSGDV